MMILIAAMIAALMSGAGVQASNEAELMRLETVWNQAHLAGNVAALDELCADALVVTVPGMPAMGKADILGFWKSGRAKITRYETSELHVQPLGDTAVVNGRLLRTRDFNGKVVDDDWRFTKTLVRRNNRWQVIAFHASNTVAQ